MSDQIQLMIGAAPWRPSTDSEVVEEYARYDMPTAGVISQFGCHFLFECLEGVTHKFNVWLYAPINKKEEWQLSQLSGPELGEAIDEIWASRDLTVSVAEGDAIWTGGSIPVEAVKRFGARGAAYEVVHAQFKKIDEAGAFEAAV